MRAFADVSLAVCIVVIAIGVVALVILSLKKDDDV